MTLGLRDRNPAFLIPEAHKSAAVMNANDFPAGAIQRARDGAEDWLAKSLDGYPRSWAQEEREQARRGYATYDEVEAPPIAGYEALERDGLAERMGLHLIDGLERVHFRALSKLVDLNLRDVHA